MTDLVFDFDAVTPRMLIDFKEKTGESLMALVDEKSGGFDLAGLSPEALAGFIWLGLRMSGNPEATWNDALDIPFSELNFAEEQTPDPTTASSGS